EIEDQKGNLIRFSHTANRLGLGQLFKHFFLVVRVMLLQITIYKWRMNPTGRDAVATDVKGKIILSDRKGHAYYGPFGGGVSESVLKAHIGRNRSHIKDDPTFGFHHWENLVQAVVSAFHIHSQQTVKISL